MPRDFEFPLVPGHFNNSELWVPMSFTQQELTTGAASWNFAMVGRLKAGITAAEAQSDAERVAQETMRSYPSFMSSLRIQAMVRSLHEQTVEQARRLVRTLFLAAMVVLLIACANLAGLLLVRGIRRRRQITRTDGPGSTCRYAAARGGSRKPLAEYYRRRVRCGSGGYRAASGHEPAA